MAIPFQTAPFALRVSFTALVTKITPKSAGQIATPGRMVFLKHRSATAIRVRLVTLLVCVGVVLLDIGAQDLITRVGKTSALRIPFRLIMPVACHSVFVSQGICL